MEENIHILLMVKQLNVFLYFLYFIIMSQYFQVRKINLNNKEMEKVGETYSI